MTLSIEQTAMAPDAGARLARRLCRIETAITDQRAFLYRIPDPDTRDRAESHLIRLVAMREHLLRASR